MPIGPRLPTGRFTRRDRPLKRQKASFRSLPAVKGSTAVHVSRSEVKAIDVPAGTINFASGGTVTALNLIQAGNSFFNRTGRKINMKSIALHGFINPQAVTGSFSEMYGRIMIVYDRQTNGALPTLADILQDVDQAGAATNSVLADVNLNNRERFAVVADKRFFTPQVTLTAGVQSAAFPTDGVGFNTMETSSNYRYDVFRKLKGLETHFKADSNPAVIGDIATGGLYLVTIISTSGAWQLTLKTRLRYWDP